MATTINNTVSGYTLRNPWNNQVVTFNSILQAVGYCRDHGLRFSLEF